MNLAPTCQILLSKRHSTINGYFMTWPSFTIIGKAPKINSDGSFNEIWGFVRPLSTWREHLALRIADQRTNFQESKINYEPILFILVDNMINSKLGSTEMIGSFGTVQLRIGLLGHWGLGRVSSFMCLEVTASPPSTTNVKMTKTTLDCSGTPRGYISDGELGKELRGNWLSSTQHWFRASPEIAICEVGDWSALVVFVGDQGWNILRDSSAKSYRQEFHATSLSRRKTITFVLLHHYFHPVYLRGSTEFGSLDISSWGSMSRTLLREICVTREL